MKITIHGKDKLVITNAIKSHIEDSFARLTNYKVLNNELDHLEITLSQQSEAIMSCHCALFINKIGKTINSTFSDRTLALAIDHCRKQLNEQINKLKDAYVSSRDH